MIDSARFTNPGGRDNNEDYVTVSEYGDERCFILCDGLGGHECGEVASYTVAECVSELFAAQGDYPEFLDDAFKKAQEKLLNLQSERHMENAMKTTMVVLVVTSEQIKWAHIGDSRLYRFYDSGRKYERTRDHSVVQALCDMGEITEKEMRNHPDRNKLLRVMGSEWSAKSYDKSAILEREGEMAFALMTDGFWEYVEEEEMMSILKSTDTAGQWMEAMTKLVFDRANMRNTDNLSVICVKVN